MTYAPKKSRRVQQHAQHAQIDSAVIPFKYPSRQAVSTLGKACERANCRKSSNGATPRWGWSQAANCCIKGASSTKYVRSSKLTDSFVKPSKAQSDATPDKHAHRTE
jgi:hypothetical protein